MGFLSRLRPNPDVGVPEVERSASVSGEKPTFDQVVVPGDQSKHIASVPSEDSDHEDEFVHKDMQRGIQKMEALAQIWPKWALYVTYALVWVIYFIDALEGPMGWALTPYVTSEFQLHGLTALTGVVASLVAGLARLPMAKVIDIWGRPEGLALSVVLMTIGSIMMAATTSVQMYAAAEVFSQTGGNCRNYILGVLLADTSQLKNRGLVLAYIASPYLITTFTSGFFAQAMLDGPGWRWAFGVFAILHPIINLPLFVLLMYYQRKAIRMGLVPIRNTGRSILGSVKHYFVEFDIIGLFLIIAGFAIFLLPFNIYYYQGDTLAEQWGSPLVISMIIIGLFTILAFAIWEWKFAPVQVIPFHLLKDRTILGACFIAAILFVQFFIWNAFFSSFLQAVSGLDLARTGYVQNIYSMGSCFWSFVAGLIVRYTGDTKWQSFFFGMPMTLLGVALMIAFRQPDVNIGLIVMCQIFIAFGGGTLVIAQQVIAMAATTHQYIAIVLAMLAVFNAIGGGIGGTIASAVWTGTFYQDLANKLPAETVANATLIGASLETQLLYPIGDPTRTAIQSSYGVSQRYMLIAATAITCLGFPAILMWRGIDARERKQVKGRVF
ncbi:Siderophore iron transporter mirB [Cercospora beticola]|uniref:Siderophore iron transporter mirB n=1 Tax=Cercospora beticola TaxID=122368 RepID=A0A2G5HQH7_CERBT|nr:Siderophore iron transporter mirB [Cercospora beticola]PIA94801.1 Siderophore iron transporter mirB [Cercospora beticola]WPB04797.1 hypothetical protein RHO25_009444 [Cercospora beticola]CAK1364559.1 unnamed protein product [Cercospora beticola]